MLCIVASRLIFEEDTASRAHSPIQYQLDEQFLNLVLLVSLPSYVPDQP